MGRLIEEWTKAGHLLGAEGCLPSVNGAKVRRDGEMLTVTDGPFAETKEVVGGFALLQANSKEEAIELLKVLLKVAFAARLGRRWIRRRWQIAIKINHPLQRWDSRLAG